jgi:hypothetical protein
MTAPVSAFEPRLSKDNAGVEALHCRTWSRESDWEEVTMTIDSTTFGTITIDGKTYEHDVVVRLSGEIVKRKKKLSKRLYGTSHVEDVLVAYIGIVAVCICLDPVFLSCFSGPLVAFRDNIARWCHVGR